MNKMENTVKREAAPLRLVVLPETQCRPEKWYPDRRLFAISVISVAVVASAWFLARIATGTVSTRAPLRLGTSLLKAIRSGPGYYVLLLTAMIGSVLLLVFRTSAAAARWRTPLIVFSTTVLVLTFPAHGSPACWVLWGYAAAGAAAMVGRRRISLSRIPSRRCTGKH